MALRDQLRKHVEPLLQPGESVEQVFIAQGGMTPWVANLPLFGALGALVLQSWVSRRIIAVTNREVMVIEAGKFAATSPKRVMARLPRQTTIGPVRGVWAKVRLGDEVMWVHRRFHGDVAAADARATGSSPVS